ncbi:hypothetical protein [Streptomyces sp. NPDC005096]|uniref:hypothetical protein n=1 Tax=Streptomyces sp. NPDC005096 TaxID=3154559 RepID=UPI0033B1AB27
MLILSVPMCLIAEGLAGAHRLAAASAAMGLASTGLAPGWFLVGLGRPRDILLSEGLPRMAATLVASVAMFFDGPLITFGLAQLAAGLLATPIAASRLEIRRYLIPPRTAFADAQENLSSIGLRLTSAVYVALPTTLLAHSAPLLVAGFAAVDRLMRMELVFLQVVPLSLQREFGRCPESEVARRGIRLVMLNLAVGVIGAAAFVGVFPIVFPIAFAGELWVGPLSVLAAAGVILVCSVSRATGSLWLVRRGGIRWIWASAALGAVVVWPALSSLSRKHGIPGAIAALLMVEILVLAVQCVGILLVERVSAQRVVEA